MRIVTVLTTYNEAPFVKACLENYEKQGVEVYVLDNESTDETVDLLNEFKQRNLIGLDIVPRKGVKDWSQMCMRKERLFDQLSADWYMHADIDEIRVPSNSSMTLLQEVRLADREGFNAMNFIEYTFIPTKENPKHSVDNFQDTMRHYYPFLPSYPNRMNLFKKQPSRWPGIKARIKDMLDRRRLIYPSVDLVSSGGHRVRFPGIRMYPVDLKMRHYLVLDIDHAIRKYVKIKNSPNDPSGFHGWRGNSAESDFQLPSEKELRLYTGDDKLDASNPLTKHLLVR